MEARAVLGLVVVGLTAALAAVAAVLRSFRANMTTSGEIGHPTLEEKAVLDRMQRGELTPQQEAEALGGKAYTFGTRIELVAGAGRERRRSIYAGAAKQRSVERKAYRAG